MSETKQNKKFEASQGRFSNYLLLLFSVFVHAFRGLLQTTVAEEKKYNPRLTKTVDEFVNIMNNLNLPYPKQIGELLVSC